MGLTTSIKVRPEWKTVGTAPFERGGLWRRQGHLSKRSVKIDQLSHLLSRYNLERWSTRRGKGEEKDRKEASGNPKYKGTLEFVSKKESAVGQVHMKRQAFKRIPRMGTVCPTSISDRP